MDQGQRADSVSWEVPDIGANTGSFGGMQDFDRGFELGKGEGYGTGIFVGVVLGLALWAASFYVLGVWP